jgi:hypothetical protein
MQTLLEKFYNTGRKRESEKPKKQMNNATANSGKQQIRVRNIFALKTNVLHSGIGGLRMPISPLAYVTSVYLTLAYSRSYTLEIYGMNVLRGRESGSSSSIELADNRGDHHFDTIQCNVRQMCSS